MKESVLKKMGLYTSADTLLNAQSVLDDTGETAQEHAIKMANAGQTGFVVDHLVLAIERREIEPTEAAEILIVALDKQANYYKNRGDSVQASEVRQEASEYRELISK